ncbi:MAG: RNA polymerase sigma factor [Lachnospiraceae bacterium]|nr:RNA polymerase sigma factor [Lachnospiraceae bacterium]
MSETDEVIYERFLRDRREEDLLILIGRYREGLVLFLNGFVHDLREAEELMMDTFAEVAAGPTWFSGRSSFKTWLFSVGKNLALMQLRRSRRIVLFAEETGRDDGMPEIMADGGRSLSEQTDSPELEILRSELNRQIYEAIGKLKEEYRRILILLYFEEMTHEEAGQVMRKSRRQIYHLAERGRAALKAEMTRMGVTCEITE